MPEAPAEIDLNDSFQRALTLMEETDKSLFITGKAGTGKSTLLEHFCENTEKELVVLAPTGVAALNVKGQTIHRFFNFYIDVTPEKIREKEFRPRDPKIYKKLQTVIIDEVSMVRADLLDCIDAFLRLYGPVPFEPFGGVQMIFVGDLYQLPPVVTGPEKEIFSTHYDTPYFFSAHACRDFAFETVELQKVYRQKDQRFVDLLNRIRNNSVEAQDIDLLNSRYNAADDRVEDDFYISLTTTNKNADAINDEHLQALKGKLHHSSATITGEFGKEYYPTAPELQFKIGAQVMLLNNDSKNRWVNGTIGKIEALGEDDEGEEFLKIRLQDNDQLVPVYAHMWEVYRFALKDAAIVSEPVGTFTQYPLRLAWAVTIHKSQGKTFDRVVLDIGSRGTFVPGQLYVGLSRCTSFEGVILKTPIKKNHIRADYRIFDFFTRAKYDASEQAMSMEDKSAHIASLIQQGQPLHMTYLKANDTETTRTVIPRTVGKASYRGKSYQGMQAFCTKRKEERMFRVDRILKIHDKAVG